MGMHSCNIHFKKNPQYDGRSASCLFLFWWGGRAEKKLILFFSWKNNNNCKARGCIFLSGYEEGSTSKMLLLFTLLQHYYYVFSSVKSWIRNFLGVCSEKIPKAVLIVSAKVEKNTILFNLKQFQFSKK